jgi:hypothetical protein
VKRQKLWDACYAADQKLTAAFADFRQHHTPVTRTKMSAVISEFIESLRPLIGAVATFQYEARWRAFEEALARSEQLAATIATRRTVDAADVEWMDEVSRELQRAREAFQREETAMKTLLDQVGERDEQGEA